MRVPGSNPISRSRRNAVPVLGNSRTMAPAPIASSDSLTEDATESRLDSAADQLHHNVFSRAVAQRDAGIADLTEQGLLSRDLCDHRGLTEAQLPKACTNVRLTGEFAN